MAIKKQILLGAIVYGFLGYLILASINLSLPFPLWAIGLYFALATGIFIWVCVEKDWKLRGLVGLGVLGFVGVGFLIGLLLL